MVMIFDEHREAVRKEDGAANEDFTGHRERPFGPRVVEHGIEGV